MAHFVEPFSEEIYNLNYRFGDEKLEETWFRVARTLAAVEKEPERWTARFYELLTEFKFIPGGRILANAGTGLKNTTLLNCYVSGARGTDIDSLESIQAELGRQMKILASEGGYGVCANFMRPRGAYVQGAGVESPGAVKYLEIWDASSEVITAGSGRKLEHKGGKKKSRRGAQMVTLGCWHPDIEEFITAKQTPGRLTRFNMSVLISDDFMAAVAADAPWPLEFPDYEADMASYKEHWDGDLDHWKARGGAVKVYKTFTSAAELWDLIMTSTYNRNEPGVLFIDTINRMNNLRYCEHINATNPCLPAETLVLTDRGQVPIAELIGRPFNAIVDGELYPSTAQGFWETGVKPVLQITLDNGMTVRATDNHKFMVNGAWLPLGEAKIGDEFTLAYQQPWVKSPAQEHWSQDREWLEGYFIGQLIGDGTFTDLKKPIPKAVTTIWLKHEDYPDPREYEPIQHLERLGQLLPHRSDWSGFNLARVKNSIDEYRMSSAALSKLAQDYGIRPREKKVPEQGSIMFTRAMIRGLFDADGTVNTCSESSYVRLSQTDTSRLYAIQRLLMWFGIKSTIYTERKKAGMKLMPDGKGGEKEYFCQASNELCISGCVMIKKFREEIGFSDNDKKAKLDNAIVLYEREYQPKLTAKLASIELQEAVPVYDCTIPRAHRFSAEGILVHNCGEQLLPPGGVCLLGSFNLTQFIDVEKQDFDYPKLRTWLPVAVRLLDNVNDVSSVPLPEQKENMQQKRRIGLGVMGYGSALMMLRLRYGSLEALAKTDHFMRFFRNEAYRASLDLAKEKGPFPLFCADYLDSPFVQGLNPDLQAWIRNHGLRNSHLLSVQPTGTSSILANNVSGGLEPIFLAEYIRTTVFSIPPEGLAVPAPINWTASDAPSGWSWIQEGDERLLRREFEGYTWKIDRNRGLLRETLIQDYAVRQLKSRGEWNPQAEWASTTPQLNIGDHVATLACFATHIDSSISKTCNLPGDYPYAEFKRLYQDAYHTGVIKGITTYRDGTMTSVLAAPTPVGTITASTAPVRPEVLPCHIDLITMGPEKWVVLVGLLEGRPFEVFALKPKHIQITDKIKTGFLRKVSQPDGENTYHLETEYFTIEDLQRHFESPEEESLTRMISTALKHGTDINEIYKQLQKAKGTIVSFSKAIARSLAKYVTEISNRTCEACGDREGLIFQEGCVTCKACGASKCG